MSIINFDVQRTDFQTNHHMFNFKNNSTLKNLFFIKIRESRNEIINVYNIAKAIEINIKEKNYLTYIQEDDEHDR